MIRRESWDVVIVGGGPAGSTLGTLLKKYNPEKRILLLERATFPRHHVGESLLLGLLPVLKEMGVLDQIGRAGFPKKMGATYVWGKSRKPWDINFSEVAPSNLLGRNGPEDKSLLHTWQVRRGEYDSILLKHAASCGVEVRHAWSATGIVEEAGRVIAVEARDPEGRPTRLDCGHLADCSGQSGFMSRFRAIRKHDPRLGNVALYGYFKGAAWKYIYSGHPDKTRIFTCATKTGWFWYIPIGPDLVSVGFVTHRRVLKARAIKDLKKYFLSAVGGCPEIAPLLAKASLTKEFSGDGREFFVAKDWSYLNVTSSGPGWLAAGDASVFVDPILSSGVLLAHLAGHRAACSLTTVWRGGGVLSEEAVWRDFNEYYRHAAQMFLATALFWYGNDRDSRNWWKATNGLMRASLPLPIKNRQAFVIVASGIQDYYERLYQADHLFIERPVTLDSFPLFAAGDWRGKKPAAEKALRLDLSYALLCRYETGFALLPTFGTGLLTPMKRIKFLLNPEKDALGLVVNPARLALPFHLKLLEWMDEGATLDELGRRLAVHAKLSLPLARRTVAKFVADLVMIGVAAPRKRAASRAPATTSAFEK